MGTDNRIDACYTAQAQNLFKKLKLNQNGVKVNEEAYQLFTWLRTGASKYLYMNSVDTDKDGSISAKEYAVILQRADKESRSGKLTSDRMQKNDGKADGMELLSDFAQHGAIPYLLNEAKKYTPTKYAQIEQRLKNGNFIVTREKDYNLLQEKQDGVNLATMISNALTQYEDINIMMSKFGKFKKIFFEKLAQGEVPKYEVATGGSGVNVTQDYLTEFNPPNGQVSEKTKKYSLDNMQNPTSSDPNPVSKIKYAVPDTETLDEDSLEKAAVKEICKKVLTAGQLEGYSRNITEIIKDKQKFSQFVSTLGSNVDKVLKTGASLIVTDEKFDDRAGFYERDKNRITISHPYFTRLQESLDALGVPEEKIKQSLLKETVEIVAHEYWHAAQYAFTKNPPQKATPQELVTIAKYKKNFEGTLDPTDSITLHGSADKYATQPLEKSAFDLMADIDEHINTWQDNRKSLRLLANRMPIKPKKSCQIK